MTWFRVGGAGIPASLKNAMNAVFNKKFGTSGQNYPPNGWPDDVNLLGPLPEGTASGPIANFTDGADDVPVKNVIATIAPTLTGVSSVNVTQTDGNEPPTVSETYAAQLGRTVYGGTADLVTGEGQETYGYIVFDGSDDETWYPYTNYEGYSINIATMKNGVRQDGVCNQLTNSSSTAQGQTNAFWLGVNTRRFYVLGVYQSMGSTLEAFKAFLSENPLILVYPLDTTTDFAFTGQEINSLYGVNNFWNDAGGDTTVVYRRDIDLAFQAVSSSRGLMMASRPVTQLIGEESDPDQVNELVENDETEQEGEDNAR